MILPPEARPLVAAFVLSFTSPTYRRFSTLLVGALLTTGRRTVADPLRTPRHPAPGHRTEHQRVPSRAPWSGLALGCALTRLALDHLVPDGPVRLVGDDTAGGRKGECVYGKARRRDAVRSAHSCTARRYGHGWVVLAVRVELPFATRPWGLPVLIDLDRAAEDGRARERRHRTPARVMCGLPRLPPMRFPDRTFALAGDSGCGTHAVARPCDRRRARVPLVSKLHPDADPFDPPPPYAGEGRPRVKGGRRPEPRAAAAAAAFTRLAVGWYGGGKRAVRTLGGSGHRCEAGRGLVPVRWVLVRDTSGTHRGEYFLATGPDPTPTAAIGCYRGRRNTEPTPREARSALGSEATRGWRQNTVPRAGPCRPGPYSVVAVLFQARPESKRTGAVAWPGKATVTFSDALCAVRRWRWAEAVLPQAGDGTALRKLPEPIRERLLTTLAPAA